MIEKVYSNKKQKDLIQIEKVLYTKNLLQKSFYSSCKTNELNTIHTHNNKIQTTH